MARYMFVGLGEEIHKFVQPEVHELFLRVAKANYRLMGWYQAHRVEPLTVEEWLTLPEKQVCLALKTFESSLDFGPSGSIQVLRNYTTKSQRPTFC
jgi:hypothetical protein